MSATYYDGAKLLSLKDINGDKPEIYLCTTNRTGGKTVYFNSYVVRKFIKKFEKFMLVYRFNYELDSVADKFFKDIGVLFFPDKYMSSVSRAKGIYHDLYIGTKGNEGLGEHCGYAVSLNNADQIKKNSHLFSDVKRMLMDEFQSENNHYCSNEIGKLISLHTSIARGAGEQAKYLPLYLVGNPVSLINPYYVELGISERLRSDTKFLRGEGYVLEQGFVESAANAQKESAFNRAFRNNKYVEYASQAVYLNDSTAFIEKPTSASRYLATLKYMGKEYGIREYYEDGIIYCDDRADTSYKYKISVTTDDHNINYVMLRRNDIFLEQMRYYFERGCFRFKNLRCKEVILKTLSY